MLKIKLITVGKVKDKYIKEGIAEFTKRLQGFCKFEEVELKEEPIDSPQACSKEADKIINEMNKCDYNIALAIKGEQLASEKLAEKIDKLATSGKSSIGFIIGSSHGLDESVYAKCDFKLSFSKMTFPHQLFKLILVEQIYRAFQINANGNYHK